MTDDPLALLADCSNEDLDPLVEYILKASTNELRRSEAYLREPGNHRTYVDLIKREIRTFGGNTFVNKYRGDGPPYEEVVRDVCRRLKTRPELDATVADMEWLVLRKILEEALEKMTADERIDLEDTLRNAGVKHGDKGAAGPLAVALLQGGVKVSGFAAYRISVMVANAVAKKLLGRGLSLGANAALTRTVGALAGPVGWAITGIWTAYDLSGPAYRVTIPCVCHVAMLRYKRWGDGLEDVS